MKTYRSVGRLAGAVLCLLSCACLQRVHGAPPMPAVPWPDGTAQQIREDIFGLRFRMARELDGKEAGLAFLKREFQRNPKPEVKAYMGWICLFADGWGYPQMHDEMRGLKLVGEAMQEGSIIARDVLARAKGDNMGGPAKPEEVVTLMREAAADGATRSMARLSYYYAVGYGVPRSLVEAEAWSTRAAELGQTFGWVEVGGAYESGAIRGRPDLASAMLYYYRAAKFGDDEGAKHLSELAQKGVPEAEMYRVTGLLHWANASAWTPPSRVKQYVAYLEQNAGNNGAALLELGIAHLDGEYARRDYGVVRDDLKRALVQGQTAARVYLLKMQLRGQGEPAQPKAFAEIEAMAKLGIPEAANYVGYASYWGTKEAGIKRDDAMAFHYVRLAAEKGEPMALLNLGFCYEDGIGTPKNYALAAKVYWLAYLQGYVRGRDRVRSLLPFVK